MIDLYYWPTPNGRKVTILLEELNIPYNLINIDITKGEQFNKDFESISPSNKIPAIVDHETKNKLLPLNLFDCSNNPIKNTVRRFLNLVQKLKQ